MSAAFILDCSLAMTWLFEDEATAETTKLLDRAETETALVPAFWYLEIANVIAVAERRKRITLVKSSEFLSQLSKLDLEVEPESTERAFDRLLSLCRTHGLTSYDAVYLDLAARRRLPLATLDEPLRKAAKKLGIKLLGK
jgi:predicted nucleic acid-binding protein